MALSEILPFAQGVGANTLSQGAYSADAQRPLGNQPGIARAQLVNKALLQATSVAAFVAKFIADRQGGDITDQMTTANGALYLQDAIYAAMATKMSAGGQQLLVANAGYQKLPGGLILQWMGFTLPAAGGLVSTAALVYPIAFPNGGLASAAIPLSAGYSGGTMATISLNTGTPTGVTATGTFPAGPAGFNQVSSYDLIAIGY